MFHRGLLVVLLFGSSTLSAADVFDRQTSSTIKKLIESNDAVAEITLESSAKLKPLSASITSPCVLIKTDEGNLAKALISWGGLKRTSGKQIPILLIERYTTYREDRPDLTKAHGKDVMLFPGFGFNFDLGQVVPVEEGADIEFTEKGTLKGRGAAKIVPMNPPQLSATDASSKHDPLDHEGVIAKDFSGTWKLNADGRWLGEWELKVDEGGRATGKFTSDESRNTYDLSGQVGSLPNNLKLDVFLANAQMAVDAYLWTKDKSMMAGTVTLSDRKFGFVATRVVEKP